jgi:chemotaxis signal transduction protein
MAKASAWLLVLDAEFQAAVGEREMVHLLQAPTAYEVLDAPPYCRQVILWQEELVPILDVAAWLRGEEAVLSPPLVGIFAYQIADGIAYGALPLAEVPARRQVSDEQVCPLPTQRPGWAQVALSCFKDGERSVPILNLDYLFKGGLLESSAK